MPFDIRNALNQFVSVTNHRFEQAPEKPAAEPLTPEQAFLVDIYTTNPGDTERVRTALKTLSFDQVIATAKRMNSSDHPFEKLMSVPAAIGLFGRSNYETLSNLTELVGFESALVIAGYAHLHLGDFFEFVTRTEKLNLSFEQTLKALFYDKPVGVYLVAPAELPERDTQALLAKAPKRLSNRLTLKIAERGSDTFMVLHPSVTSKLLDTNPELARQLLPLTTPYMDALVKHDLIDALVDRYPAERLSLDICQKIAQRMQECVALAKWEDAIKAADLLFSTVYKDVEFDSTVLPKLMNAPVREAVDFMARYVAGEYPLAQPSKEVLSEMLSLNYTASEMIRLAAEYRMPSLDTTQILLDALVNEPGLPKSLREELQYTGQASAQEQRYLKPLLAAAWKAFEGDTRLWDRFAGESKIFDDSSESFASATEKYRTRWADAALRHK